MTQQCYSQLIAAADEPEQLFGRAARAVTSLLSTPLGQGSRQNQAVVPWSEKLPHTVLTCRTNWNRPVTVNSPFLPSCSYIMCYKLQMGLNLKFLNRQKSAIRYYTIVFAVPTGRCYERLQSVNNTGVVYLTEC